MPTIQPLARLSTTHIGTAFEHRCLNILQNNLSMSLTRVGGKSDGGIDLLGWWWLPELQRATEPLQRKRIRILAQCKAEKRKMGPHYVREMEGVLYRYMSKSDSEHADPTVALLLSQSAFTKETLLRANSSPVPMFLLHIPIAAEPIPTEGQDELPAGHFGSAVWNAALGSEKGLLKGQVEARWEWPQDGNGIGRPGLWFQGKRLGNFSPSEVSKGDAEG
ncbi:hypothetical protein C8J56DRAFT_929990 [Mycena floridula]|nr:hypothetical protein C8J56DRAFT_929990 [Mycena floridula]